MIFFLDTSNIKEIEELLPLGVVDGVTTNPSIIAKSGRKLEDAIKDICSIVSGPVSAEVISENYEGMISEAEKLTKLGKQVVVKLPITYDGLRACATLSKNNIDTNLTLCFSLNQAVLAAKAGATYISPFVGRLDDIGQDGMMLIEELVSSFYNYPELNSQILVASIRSLKHITEAITIGADIITAPPHLIKAMINHELTSKGLEIFKNDWSKAFK